MSTDIGFHFSRIKPGWRSVVRALVFAIDSLDFSWHYFFLVYLIRAYEGETGMLQRYLILSFKWCGSSWLEHLHIRMLRFVFRCQRSNEWLLYNFSYINVQVIPAEEHATKITSSRDAIGGSVFSLWLKLMLGNVSKTWPLRFIFKTINWKEE